jgi:hypothetical protein
MSAGMPQDEDMNRSQELEDQVRRLSSSVEEMKAQLARLQGGKARTEEKAPRSSRRGFLRLGGAALLGSLGLAATKVLPASAANGGTFTLGQANLAESPTTIKGDGGTPPAQVLAAEDATFSSSALTTAGGFNGTLQGLGAASGAVEGVDGWAQGSSAIGVYGLTDSGYGVVGESSTGVSVWARRSGRIRQDGLVASGTPVYAPSDFEFVRDSHGVPYVSVAGGVWKQVMTTDQGLHLFPDPRRVYDGFVQSQAPGLYGPVDATHVAASLGGALSGVPLGAQAAWCAVMSYSAGVMTIYPDGAVEPVIGSWANGVSGPLGIFYMFVPLSSSNGSFRFHAFFTGVRFFDVWGYLM